MNESISRIGFSNMKLEAVMDQNNTKNSKYQKLVAKAKEASYKKERSSENFTSKRSIPDMAAYENLPYVRVSVLSKNRPSEPNNVNYEESQMYSILNSKNIEANDSRTMFGSQTHYKNLPGTEYKLDDRSTRNLPHNMKMDHEFWIDGKTDFLQQLESGLKPLPYKPKIKGNKLRKKSKLKDAKFIKEKDQTPTSNPLSSKGYLINATSATSTPINVQEKFQGAWEPNSSVSGYKNGTNSFVFMKNSVAAMRKAHSYPTNQEADELDDAKEDTSKDSGEIF